MSQRSFYCACCCRKSSAYAVFARKCRLAVVGVFALGVGVVHDQAKAPPPLIVVHYCSISRSPSELPKAAIRTSTDILIDANGLAGLVIDEIDLRQTEY